MKEILRRIGNILLGILCIAVVTCATTMTAILIVYRIEVVLVLLAFVMVAIVAAALTDNGKRKPWED